MIDFISVQFDINTIVAVTDDDAIAFYQKYGFFIADTTVKSDTKRYTVVRTFVES